MTEAEWLAATDPTPMLVEVAGKESKRKARLFACACCRRIIHLIPQAVERWRGSAELYTEALMVSERYADGLATFEELRARHIGTGGDYACDAIAVTNDLDNWEQALATVAVWASAAMTSGTDPVLIPWQEDSGPAGPSQLAEQAVQCDILRDIFGNPFRPVAFNPEWRTSTVLAVANGIYENRAFDRLPILADALQDAGCDSDDVLNHLRGDGPHCRGCWPLDLVLGKE